jgi:hypothetical protein
MAESEIDPKLIDRIDEAKRASVRKMLLGTAFIVPAVASFSLNGFTIDEAHATALAYCSNCSNF